MESTQLKKSITSMKKKLERAQTSMDKLECQVEISILSNRLVCALITERLDALRKLEEAASTEQEAKRIQSQINNWLLQAAKLQTKVAA